jgi:TolB protein
MGPARIARPVIVLIAGVALASCTATTPTSSTASLAATPSASSGAPDTVAEPPAAASELPGSLLITTAEGGLLTIRPDATQRRALVEVGGDAQVQDAAWAPDGRSIAWSQIDLDDGGLPIARVVIADAHGPDRVESTLEDPAFYLSWDPTSSRVAFLAGIQPAYTLGLVERAGGDPTLASDTGAPFFLSWAPEGDRLVTHVGASGLDEVDLEGGGQTLDQTSAFQAPAWSADGRSIAYARTVGSDGEGQLVVRDTQTDRVRPIADVAGTVYLVLSPDGRRVAFHGRPDDGTAEPIPDLGVRIAEVDGSGEMRATTDPAIAWSWSPDGSRLAVLELDLSDPDAPALRWRVWSDRGSFTTPTFTGSAGLQQQASFFTQYVQSTTMWSPDGQAFAYPAGSPDGRALIWVQPARRGAEPFAIAEGARVAWSPPA